MPSVFFISLMNGEPWGGSEESWYHAALYAAKNGYTVACAAFDWPEKQQRFLELERAGCTVYRLSNKGHTKRNLKERIQFKITKRRLKKYVRSLPFRDYNMVVVNLGLFEMESPYWEDLNNYLPAYSLLYHNYVEGQVFSKRKIGILRNWISRSKVNLFDSRRIQNYLEEQLEIKVPKPGTLFNPVTFTPPEKVSEYPALRNGNYVFVMLAALDVFRKAQDNLLSALASAKWKERNWILELYGTGKDKEMLGDMIKENGLEEKVFLKGHTKDVRSVLDRSHILFQVTKIDAMPLAVVEALSMSRPVVVSDVGDMASWVLENVNGWIAENASVEQIDDVLEKAWLQREKWNEKGKASYKIFRQKYPDPPELHLLQQLGF
jgi:glycosyltransferase involved in cell wall biosynthesis